jgi:hypothetical protein
MKDEEVAGVKYRNAIIVLAIERSTLAAARLTEDLVALLYGAMPNSMSDAAFTSNASASCPMVDSVLASLCALHEGGYHAGELSTRGVDVRRFPIAQHTCVWLRDLS